jgi:tetratricopeptide repeat protein 8
MLKCQCLIKENYVDELETEEEGIAELMVKEQDSNTLARPGTSFRSPAAGNNPIMRPLNSGRVATGFQRAGTSVGSRAASRSNGMLRTGRVMTKGGVPTTSNGRILRLSTASL